MPCCGMFCCSRLLYYGSCNPTYTVLFVTILSILWPCGSWNLLKIDAHFLSLYWSPARASGAPYLRKIGNPSIM